MSWDDDDKNRQKDPWRGRGGEQGPPDLDEIVRRIKRKMQSSFGGKGGGVSRPGKGGASLSFGLIIVALLVLWFVSGIYIVKPAEKAVVLRFGKYVTTVDSGPHWIPRFINSRYVVNVQQISYFKYKAEMLTKDENIVAVDLSVQYRAGNPKDYLFNVVSPESSLQQATASALRQVIGNTTLDSILTTGREEVRTKVNENLVAILDQYKTGLDVVDVNLEPAKPPEQVTEAFDDAVKAREDEQRYINQAEAYAEKVTATLRGRIRRLLEAAEADRRKAIEGSKADIAGYLALLPEYKSAPTVMRERMYLDTLENILSKSSKVLVDIKGGNNMMYLPLDKILERQRTTTALLEGMDEGNDVDNTLKSTKSTDEPFSSRPGYPDDNRGGYQWQD